jgi:hypothetical protein
VLRCAASSLCCVVPAALSFTGTPDLLLLRTSLAHKQRHSLSRPLWPYNSCGQQYAYPRWQQRCNSSWGCVLRAAGAQVGSSQRSAGVEWCRRFCSVRRVGCGWQRGGDEGLAAAVVARVAVLDCFSQLCWAAQVGEYGVLFNVVLGYWLWQRFGVTYVMHHLHLLPVAAWAGCVWDISCFQSFFASVACCCMG